MVVVVVVVVVVAVVVVVGVVVGVGAVVVGKTATNTEALLLSLIMRRSVVPNSNSHFLEFLLSPTP